MTEIKIVYHRDMFKGTLGRVSMLVLSAISFAVPAHSQGSQYTALDAVSTAPSSVTSLLPQSTVRVPMSSRVQARDYGYRAHTNYLVAQQSATPFSLGGTAQPAGSGGPNGGYSPIQVQSAYGVSNSGGAGTIAIIIAFHYPTAKTDFNTFSKYFGLNQETSINSLSGTNKVFQVSYVTGRMPAVNSGWNTEAALDIEWTHAMAPNAKIVLVEAVDATYTSLFNAVKKAATLPGVRQISMSWGGDEFSGEYWYDSNFKAPGVTYLAATGDVGGVIEYPAASPNVVSVGGTSLAIRSTSTGTGWQYSGESGWSGSGGGVSGFEPLPSYQKGVTINGATFTGRSTPDISAVADPGTGVAVCYNGGWTVLGGTSVATPVMAGIINSTGGNRDTQTELTKIYSGLRGSSFHDITTGKAGSYSAFVGYDNVTGVGSPVDLSGL